MSLFHNDHQYMDNLDWSGKGEPTNAAYIRQCLSLANDLQVRLYVNFTPPLADARVSLFAVCVGMDEQSFSLYLLGDVSDLPPVGKEVEVFFILRQGKRGVPCLFPTRVYKVNGSPEGHNLILKYPKYISHNQRRYTVRVPVEKDRIPGFSIWHGTVMGSVRPSGGPALAWTKLPYDKIDLVDLSAGGMRLRILAGCANYHQLQPKELLLVKGDFALPGKKSLPLLILGRILRQADAADGNGKMLAIRFQKEFQLDNNAPVWQPINEQDGVADIRPWVFNLLAEISRLRKEKEAAVAS